MPCPSSRTPSTATMEPLSTFGYTPPTMRRAALPRRNSVAPIPCAHEPRDLVTRARPRSPSWARRVARAIRPVSAVVVTVLALAACGTPKGPYGQPVHFSERATVAGHEVTDEAFASAVRDLLAAEPGSRERSLRLEAVVAKQLSRATKRMQGADKQRGIAAIAGAMYLTRAGELTKEMLGTNGANALGAASLEFAKRGDDGRARAMYEMLLRVAPPAEQPDIKLHIQAIDAWTRDTVSKAPLVQAGAAEVHAVTRHLLEPRARLITCSFGHPR